MEPPEHARAAAPGGSGDPMVGRLLERRYRIGPRIARGGMASVYEATDTRLDRTVAVKVMHPGLGDDQEFAERFVREARAAARLNHPHVVGVYDQGDDTSDGQDTVFLVMEYVPGHTLRDVVRKEAPMPPRRALALLEPVVSALGAAHRAGLIHRDVKPENVLIADEAHGGRIKVADFGLAKAVSADTQHTATGGVLIGTVSYLAPELVVDGRADARADVYAVGVVLYELLTGAKPHEGESPIQVAYRHVHHDVPMPSLAAARHPRLRRRARRPRHLPRPRPAARRRHRPAAPPPPRRAGAARGARLRPRAGRRPAPPPGAGRRGATSPATTPPPSPSTRAPWRCSRRSTPATRASSPTAAPTGRPPSSATRCRPSDDPGGADDRADDGRLPPQQRRPTAAVATAPPLGAGRRPAAPRVGHRPRSPPSPRPRAAAR